MEKWFAFRSYNSQTIYGFGTDQDADRYIDTLNTGREINVYGAYALGEDEAGELGLDDNTDALNLDDALAEIDGKR